MLFDRRWLLTVFWMLAVPTAALCDATSSQDRRSRLEQMSAAEKEELLRNQERFQRLPQPEQQRLRQLHTAILADPRSRRLRQVMLRYHEWLRTLPSGQRAQLLSLPAEARLEEIQQVIRRQERQQFNDLTSRRLLPADREAILAWLADLMERREGELLAALPPEAQSRMRSMSQPERRRSLMFHHRRRLGPERSVMDLIQLTDEDVDRLSQQLSPEVRQTLQDVQGEQERQDMLRRWVAAALFSRAMPSVNSEDLKAFFDKLPPASKEHLENLPKDRMMSELRRLYVKQRLEERGGRPFRKRGRGAPSPRGRQ